YHKRMHLPGRGPQADRSRTEAVARVGAVEDERAAPAIWKEFAFDARHHGLTVRVLGRIRTAPESQRLAAQALISSDAMARPEAAEALRGRDPSGFGELLVNLMNRRLSYKIIDVPRPDQSAAKMMLVDGEKADFAYLFYREDAPSPALCDASPRPYLNPEDTILARKFNQDQAALARAGLDQQLRMAKQAIDALNASIDARNERVAAILNSACGAGIQP